MRLYELFEMSYFAYICEQLNEAVYDGNIGMMELVRFDQIANSSQKNLLKQLISQKKNSEAWDLIQKVLGVRLKGNSFS